MEARPTTYKGIQMRSRLEALYAQRLDNTHMGLANWEYEPQCYASPLGQYLPDFRMTFEDGRVGYVEVKPPSADPVEALERMHIILESEPDVDLMVAVSDGRYPEPSWSFHWCDWDRPCCHRRSARPLLIWRTSASRDGVPFNPSGPRNFGHGNLAMFCAHCRRPNPRIEDAVALPMAGDPEGPKVQATIRMYCDHCGGRWWLQITSSPDGPQTLITVRADPRDSLNTGSA